MKQKVALILLVAGLVSCASPATALPIITPTLTSLPTSTLPPTETPIPTTTSTPIPSIQVDGSSLPDPRFTDPELFSLLYLDAPIPQFVSVLSKAGIDITKEQVASELYYQQFKDSSGNPFYAALFHLDIDPQKEGENMEGDFPLLIATDEQGEYKWKVATVDAAANVRGLKFGVLLGLYEEAQKVTAANFGAGVTFTGWEYTHPSADTYDWQELEFHIAYSREHNLEVIAHPLIWGQSVPDWVQQIAGTPEELHEIMLSHISTAVDHFKGQVDYWVVVNEANHLGRDIFWRVIGPSYINDAYARVRSIDPDAKLVYNDYIDLFDTGHIDQDKRIKVIEEVVASLMKDGNIDVIGLQIDGDINMLNMKKLEEGLERLKRFGLPIMITEFSLRISAPETPQNLQKQAEIAKRIMQVLVRCECVIGINQWGLSNDDSNPIYGANANVGLYGNDNGLVPKPVIYGIISGFVLPPQ
jgi:endo-1,4-beta-xylanase